VTEVLFEEGQVVTAGQIMARLDTSRLESQRQGLQARLQELEAQYGLASVTLSRQRELNKKGWQSHQRFDEARFKSAQLAAAVRRVKASIASIDIELAKSDLKAPFSGIVAARNVDEGSVVSAGTPVMDLSESGARRARVGVSLAVANSLELKRMYRLTSGERDFEGRLFSKRPDLQTGTRTVTALFEVSGAENVPVGGLIELAVARSVKADGLWLPITALSEGTKGLWTVFSIVGREGASTVERKAVEVLHLENGRAYVRGNFSEDNRIVINGTNRVIPGQRVASASRLNQQ
jgi:RND family efflux transporter MFP subunit